MFSVTVDDKEYKVEFCHWNPVKFSEPDKVYFLGAGYEFGTLCRIVVEDLITTRGETYLHPLDMNSYKKNFGRKEAMTRALQRAFPGEDNKETRRKFWQAYYEARGKKW